MGLGNCAGGGCGGPGQQDGPCAPVCTTAPGLKLKGPARLGWAPSWSLAHVPCPSPRASCVSASLAWSLLPHSDVTFVVGREQQKVFAHRCVLACRCQAFQGMLSQGPVGSEDSPKVLTSSVEYGLQDLCKVWLCLDWGWWSPSAPGLRSTPRWSPHGWWL
uniref:BTB domain-containing protein n=1 Tax=Bubo bubo TaxID=30461 RepID=A0A8C0FFX2_BUBBB